MEKHDMISEVKETTDQRQVWANCSKQTIRHRLYGSTYYIICFFLGFGFDSGPNLQPFNSWWNFDEQDLYSTLDADLKRCKPWPETRHVVSCRYFPVSLHNFVVFIQRRSGTAVQNPKKETSRNIVDTWVLFSKQCHLLCAWFHCVSDRSFRLVALEGKREYGDWSRFL